MFKRRHKIEKAVAKGDPRVKELNNVFYTDDYPAFQRCSKCQTIVSIDPGTEENLKTVRDPKSGCRVLVLDCPECIKQRKDKLKGKAICQFCWSSFFTLQFDCKEDPELGVWDNFLILGPFQFNWYSTESI
jgi:hypothetical protein